jgi:hypothetical protein
MAISAGVYWGVLLLVVLPNRLSKKSVKNEVLLLLKASLDSIPSIIG